VTDGEKLAIVTEHAKSVIADLESDEFEYLITDLRDYLNVFVGANKAVPVGPEKAYGRLLALRQHVAGLRQAICPES
jgi:hypothetical protein